MSTDFAISHACPHFILEEVVPLSSDRMSLPTLSPIASSNLVRVLANDTTYIPASGLNTQAQITGSISGPYSIPSCDTSFTVTSSSETVTVVLPIGSRVEAKRILSLLLNSLQNVTVEMVKNRLTLTDVSHVGIESSIRVSGAGASHLGFATQRGDRGKEVYPAWRLVPQATDKITGQTNLFPRFTDVVRQNPVFKVTYATVPNRCMRCGGTRVENDYQFDIMGEPIMIVDENLLEQAALKMILTQLNSNPYHTWYGSNLTSRIGSKAVGAITMLLTEDVQTALSNLQKLQKKQGELQQVSLKERLYSVQSIKVTPTGNDQTSFNLDIVVMNASNQPVSLSRVFTVSGVSGTLSSMGNTLLRLNSVG